MRRSLHIQEEDEEAEECAAEEEEEAAAAAAAAAAPEGSHAAHELVSCRKKRAVGTMTTNPACRNSQKASVDQEYGICSTPL